MSEFFSTFFDTSMMPHGHCYLWNDGLVSLHVISDVLIAVSYFTIPVALITLVRRREDLQFNYIFVFFALFIFACGATHLMAIYNVWNGAYWVSGTIKAVAAVASVITAILVWPLIPKALALPSNTQLMQVNERLKDEVAANKQLSEKLERLIVEREKQATHDALTSLRNRRGFEERWEEEVGAAQRNSSSLLVMMIDLDHFKRVNDDYGHAAGDALLKAVSAVIQGSLRVNDIGARFGGEEFVVALPATGLEEGAVIAERLRTSVEECVTEVADGEKVSITCSIGMSLHVLENSLADTMREADACLYQAKEQGRNRVCLDVF